MLKIKDMNLNNVIRQGDSQPREYQLDTGNLDLNLTNKSATIRLMTADFQGIGYETAATVSSENKISFSIDDVIPARQYRLEVTVDDYVFPSRATDSQFNIDPSSHGQEVNIINVIGKEEIVRDVKARVENELEPFLGEIEQAETQRQSTFETNEQNREGTFTQAELARQEAEGEREETHEKVKDLPEAFQNVIDEITGKDVISAPEIIAARKGKASLGAKIDDVDRQLAQKIGGGVKGSLSDFDEETLNFIHDGTGGPIEIGSRPEDYSVGPKQTTFIKVSSNLLNTNEREDGYRTNVSDGSLESHVQFAVSDFIPVEKGTQYTMHGVERYSLYDSSKNHINSRSWVYASDIRTVTTTDETRFIRISFRQPIYNTVFREARLNEGEELLPYEPFYIPILDKDKVKIEIGKIDNQLEDYSVEPKHTTFFSKKSEKNLFDGNYVEGTIFLMTSSSPDFHKCIPLANEDLYNGRIAIVPVEPNKTYTLKFHETEDLERLRIGASSGLVPLQEDERDINVSEEIPEHYQTIRKVFIYNSPVYSTTVTTEANENFLYINHTGSNGSEPVLQVEEGSVATDYVSHLSIPKELLDPDLTIDVATNKLKPNYYWLDTLDGIYKASDSLADVDSATHGTVYNFYDQLVADFPEHVSSNVLGYDALENEIREYVFGMTDLQPQTQGVINVSGTFNKKPRRLKFLVTGGVHGNEKIPIRAGARFFDELYRNPENKEVLDVISSNVDFRVVPLVNPNGVDRNARSNHNGIDLNRNFTDSDTAQEETKVVINWLEEHDDAFFHFDWHDHPYDGTGDLPMAFVSNDDTATLVYSLFRTLTREWSEEYGYDSMGETTGYLGNEIGGNTLTRYAESLGIGSLLLEVGRNGFRHSSSDLDHERTSLEVFANFIITVLKSM